MVDINFTAQAVPLVWNSVCPDYKGSTGLDYFAEIHTIIRPVALQDVVVCPLLLHDVS